MGDYTYSKPGQREPDQWNTGAKLQSSLGQNVGQPAPNTGMLGSSMMGGYPETTRGPGIITNDWDNGVTTGNTIIPLDQGKYVGNPNHGGMQATPTVDMKSIRPVIGGHPNAGFAPVPLPDFNMSPAVQPDASPMWATAPIQQRGDAPPRGFEGVPMTPEQSPPTQDVLGITEQDSNSLAAPLQASSIQQPIQQPIQPVVSPLHRQQPLQVTQAPQIMQGIGALQSPTQAYNSTQPMHQAPLQDRQQSTGFGLSNPGTSYHTGLSQTPSSSPLYAQQDQEAQSVFTGPEQGSKAWWLR